MKYLLVTFGFVMGFCSLRAQGLDNGEAFFAPHIASVECLKNGKISQQPIISLRKNETLQIFFDELFADEIKNYSFSAILCDSEWNPLSLPKNEYLSGFLEDFIETFEPSETFGIPYISYRFEFPTQNLSIKKSGNYLLYVMEDSDPEKIVLKKRVYVFDELAKIDASVVINEQAPYHSGKQSMNLRIDLQNLNVANFRNDIVVVVQQNGRSDNQRFFSEPDFIDGKVLRYESLNTNRTFEGGIEYRNLDLTTSNFNSPSGVATLNPEGIHEFSVVPHVMRITSNYSFLNDINGEKIIENKVGSEKHRLPYAQVRFTVVSAKEFQTGDIHLLGSLTNWQQDSSSQFRFNPETQNYELTLWVKQGYYDYLYGFQQKGQKPVSVGLLCGSSFETENDYHIFVYLKNRFPRYDRLIGYKKINSRQR